MHSRAMVSMAGLTCRVSGVSGWFRECMEAPHVEAATPRSCRVPEPLKTPVAKCAKDAVHTLRVQDLNRRHVYHIIVYTNTWRVKASVADSNLWPARAAVEERTYAAM